MAKTTPIDPETQKPMPEPANFAHWFTSLMRGECNAETGEMLQRLVEMCESNAKAMAPRTVKATMSLHFAIAVSDTGAATIDFDLKHKDPPKIRSRATAWANRGNLQPMDPKQAILPFSVVEGGGRAVNEAPGGGREIKEVGGRGTPQS